jgi:hypothetical protein
MVKEEMLEQIKKDLCALPDRKSLKYDDDILRKYKLSSEESDLDIKSELDPFKRITEIILF